MPNKKIPRYRAIAEELMQAIAGEKYPVGSQLPAESELCEQLQASRHTIREALRILEERGLISRRQGSGSAVIALNPPARLRQMVDNIEDLLQYGSASRLLLLKAREIPVDANQALLLGCAEGTRCIELTGLRRERGDSGRPFALSQVLFPPQPARRREILLKRETALATMLESLDASNLGRIEQTFDAVALDTATAAHLQTRKGAPSLRAQRAYYDHQGALILVAISWHRADLFRISTVLRHESS